MRGPLLRAVPAILALSSTATAQVRIDGFALQQFDPSYAGDGFLTVPEAGTRRGAGPFVKLTLNYGHSPLRVVDDGSHETLPGGVIVRHQLYAHGDISYAPMERLKFGVGLPLAVIQSGDTGNYAQKIQGARFADARVGVRANVYGQSDAPLALALQVDMWIPTGTEDSFTGDGAPRAHSRVVLGGLLKKRLVYGLSLGANVRQKHDVGVGELGSSMSFSGGLGLLLLDRRFRIGPEVYGATEFVSRRTPIEAILAASYCASSQFAVGAGMGPGFTGALGVPDFRGLLSIGYEPGRCGRSTEDANHGQKREPVPVPLPAPVCVLPPAQADRDGDGIVDGSDACPDVAGVPADDPLSSGCPIAAEPVSVDVTFQQQVFFKWGKSELGPAGMRTLRNVASILKTHPEITELAIVGHADSLGDPPNNQVISDQRAAVVRDWLVSEGIDPRRLTAEGVGTSSPAAENDTEQGRQRNRRVVFRATLTEPRVPPAKPAVSE